MSQAVRASPVPAPGHYQATALIGTVNANLAAFAEVFQFRWEHATKKALIRLVRIDHFRSMATGFTAGYAQFGLFLARGWTVDGSGGSAGVVGSGAKLAAGMPNSSGALRTAGATALGAGTKTGDSWYQAVSVFNVSAAAGTAHLGAPGHVLYRAEPFEHPLILANEEGLVMDADVPAAGTWQLGLTVAWSEIDP